MPVIAALVLLTTVGGGAAAAPPEGLEAYDAGATTTAFDLGVADQQFAAGLTVALLTSEGPASMGDGAALLIAGTPSGEPVSQAPEGPAEAEDCPIDIEEQFPDPIDTASLEIGCVRTTAPDTEHSTSASESATVGVLGSGLSEELTNQLLEPLTAGLADLIEGIDGGLAQLCDGLVDLGLLGTGDDCSTEDVLTQLKDNLVDPDGTIATVAVAPGGSETAADDTEGVLARAVSNGAVIKVLPNELLYGTDELGEPNGAITIRVGPSMATATADPDTAAITTDASVGLVTVEPGEADANAIAQLLNLDEDDGLLNTIVDGLNDGIAQLADANALACGEGSPLEDLICLDAAEAKTDLDQAAIAAIRPEFDFGAGTTGARASALGVRLLSAAQEGGLVSLYLADALAAVNAVEAMPAESTTTTTTPPTTEETLPRTGSGDFAPMALAAGLGLAGVVLGLRRRLFS